jgi:hypothetical protein
VEEIIVTIPRERPFGAVAGFVLGGVAARQGLTIDVLDDLHLALDSLLDREGTGDGDVTVVLRASEGAVEASIGPFDRATVAELEQETDERLGLRRLLTTVVDSVELADREDGCWVDLHKTYALTAEVH